MLLNQLVPSRSHQILPIDSLLTEARVRRRSNLLQGVTSFLILARLLFAMNLSLSQIDVEERSEFNLQVAAS